ncbi:ATP-binding protein [Undibacterium flavidum]|uniref:histidine kinase n=1 Tax=Undibacterium flavidum TaxID=2762297 RepID=A0ABR6Y7G2_9BURK|nr:ATP-binding protein [Undibacterium flavidum]MBC3872554.1 PAS domain S-box protein [Undibacterium flavidum]
MTYTSGKFEQKSSSPESIWAIYQLGRWRDINTLAVALPALLGLLALIGWIFSIPILKSLLPGAIAMKANTALGLVTSASALFLLSTLSMHPMLPKHHSISQAVVRRIVAQVLAGLTLLIGSATLGQHLFGWELGIDELLFRDTVDTLWGTHGRMAPLTALGFMCIGISILLMSWRIWRLVTVLLSLSIVFIGAISVLGYVWNASELVTDRILPPLAINTAIAFVMLGASILYSSLRGEQTEVENSLVEKKILLAFLSAFVLLVIVGGYAYRTSAKLANSMQQLNHIQRMRVELGQLYGTMADIEALQRHYLITANPVYKDEFQRLATVFSAQLQRRLPDTIDDPEYRQAFLNLRSLMSQRLTSLQTQLAQLNPPSRAQPQRDINDDGIRVMSGIRGMIDNVSELATKRVSQGELALSENRLLTLILLLSTLVLLIFIFAILFFGVRREIRNRQQIEAQLRDSSVRMQTLLSSVVDGVITMNQFGVVESFNPAAERLFAYSAHEVIGQNLSMLMPEPHHTLHDDYLLRYRNTGDPHILGKHLEVTGRRKDGTEIALDLGVSEMVLNGERFFTGIVRDISVSKKAEIELRASEERYRMLFDTMDEGFCVLEMIYDERQKVVDYRFIEINKEFEKQTGLQNALHKTILELVPDHDVVWFDIFENVVKTGESIRVQNPVEAIQRHFDIFASKIDGDDSHRVGVIFKDITDRQRDQDALLAAKEQAELANRTKDSFLATMSHEIRTPLTGMLGMLELLSMSHLEAEQLTTLNSAWSSARALLRIVNDILDWSKIQEGKLQLTAQASSIPQLLQDVVNTYSRVASLKTLVLRQTTDSQIAAAHLVDPLRLSQILNNFVSNAIKFTPHGEVVVRAELIAQLPDAQRIRFSVRDTGIGISKDVQEHLFQRYQQGGSGTARMYGGTGLGLAICRTLAHLMEGEIALESELGQGATFSLIVDLPVTALPEVALQSMHHELEQRTVTPLYTHKELAPVVLAVDDHPVNRNLLARQLALLGLQVETAEDGRKALALWQTGRFALLITDCHMPEMDGYALTKAIRELEAARAGAKTLIIAWTANALGDEYKICMDAGMDELLVKPNNLLQLKKALEKYLYTPASQRSPAVSATNALTLNSSITNTTDADVGAQPIIDFAKFSQVVPDRAEHLQVLQDFCDYMRVDCAELPRLQQAADFHAIQSSAHRMKGSSRMVGAEPLAGACLALENAAKQVDIVAVQQACKDLEQTYTQFVDYLDALSCGALKESGVSDEHS